MSRSRCLSRLPSTWQLDPWRTLWFGPVPCALRLNAVVPPALSPNDNLQTPQLGHGGVPRKTRKVRTAGAREASVGDGGMAERITHERNLAST